MFQSFGKIIGFVSLSLGIQAFWGHGTARPQEGTRTTKYQVVVDTSPSMFQKPDSPLAIDWKEPAMLEVQRQLGEFVSKLPDGTELDLASFDTAYRPGPSLVVRDPQEREAARQYFQSLRSIGGMTHLWSSMDVALEQASSWLAAHPGSTIRILFYTDGTDTEHLGKGGVKRDPQVILAKYSDVLKNQVKFNLVTIGFELQSDVVEKLEAAHVNVTKAVSTQQNLVPLESAFRLTPDHPIVGDTVRLFDESQGLHIIKRETNWGDGTVDQEQSHTYRVAREYVVRYTVTTEANQVAVSTQRIIVSERPVIELPKLQAAFTVAKDRLELGDEVQVIDDSVASGNVVRRLLCNGKPVSNEKNPRFKPMEAGEHTLQLELHDEHGQVSQASKTISVALPPAPKAQFRLSSSQIALGESVQVVDESERAETWSWKTTAGHLSNLRNPSFQFQAAGEFECLLDVTDRFGQKSSSTVKLTVVKPNAPLVDFFLPESVMVDSDVQVINRSSGPIASQQWTLDGAALSVDRDLQLRRLSVGEHLLELAATGPGGVSRLTKKLVVMPYPKPVAAFTIGTERPFVGDTITFTDTSTGKVDRVEWWFGETAAPESCDYTKPDASRTVDFACTQAGPLVIRAKAYGPSGTSDCERTIMVGTRTQAPKTLVTASAVKGRGRLPVRFDNCSVGTIYKTLIDFGDGSPVLELDGCAGATHEYGPCHAEAKITSIGPAEFGNSTYTIDIDVAKPTPAWVWHSLWATPMSLAAVLCSLIVLRRHKDEKDLDDAAKLNGVFAFKMPSQFGMEFETVNFDGSKNVEQIPLCNGHTATLCSSVVDGDIRFFIDINENGKQFSEQLISGMDMNVGSYTVNYAQ